MIEHEFTKTIKATLENLYSEMAEEVLEKSQLIQYINLKTRSANKGSKSRSSFANLYAVYVLVEDYIDKGYLKKGNYSKNYEGALFTTLYKRQRELPFGSKLQNHALNNRMTSEFQKFFPNSELVPITRNLDTGRYWINESLIKLKLSKGIVNIAPAIKLIIEEYIKMKQDAFDRFIKACIDVQNLDADKEKTVMEYIIGLLAPSIDARLFEIVSFSILKYFYCDDIIYWGFERVLNKLKQENLKLYKTGRTNANDGGIDFVMRPLGRFFQVTETLDFKKYFLDIEKIQKYPLTFVIKSVEAKDVLIKKIKDDAMRAYAVEAVVNKYIACIEDVINIPMLKEMFEKAVSKGHLKGILDEIVIQSKVEFNYEEEDEGSTNDIDS